MDDTRYEMDKNIMYIKEVWVYEQLKGSMQ